jgi:hypothetical protein
LTVLVQIEFLEFLEALAKIIANVIDCNGGECFLQHNASSGIALLEMPGRVGA